MALLLKATARILANGVDETTLPNAFLGAPLFNSVCTPSRRSTPCSCTEFSSGHLLGLSSRDATSKLLKADCCPAGGE